MSTTTALQDSARRKVRVVAAEQTPASAELFKLVAAKRQVWTLPEWNTQLAALDACDLSVADWLLTL